MNQRRAAAYYRVSQVSGRSLGRQRSEARLYAEREGLVLVPADEFEDTESASVYGVLKGKQRTDWQALLVRLDSGEIDFVILAEASRGTREQVAYQALAQVCKRHGVKIVAKGRVFDPADESDSFMLGLDVLLAVQESDRTSRRVRNGVQKSIRDGRAPAGRVPFGYLRPPREPSDPVTQVPHPEHAAIVRAAVQRITAGEVTLKGLAKEWQKITGRSWNSSSVRKALLNPSIIGRRVVGRETVKGNWEPILSERAYYDLHAYFNDPQRRTSPGPKSSRLLTSIARCVVCQGKARSKYSGSIYVCVNFCAGVSTPCDPADQLAKNTAIATLSGLLRDDLVNELRGYDPDEVDEGEFEAATLALREAEERKGEFEREAAAAGLSAGTVISTLVGFESEVKAAREALEGMASSSSTGGELRDLRERARLIEEIDRDAVEGAPRDLLPLFVTTGYGDVLLETAHGLWAAADLADRRRWVKDTVDVVIGPQGAEVTPKRGWEWLGYLAPIETTLRPFTA